MEYKFFNSLEEKQLNPLSIDDEKVFSDNKAIGIKIKNSGLLNIFNIRGNQRSSSFRSSINNLLNIEVPSKTGLFNRNKESILLNIGPDELLLIYNQENKKELIKKFEEKMYKTISALIEVSDQYHTFYLEGENTRWILSKGCPIDLDETIFLPGYCAQTLLGNSNIILFCTHKNSFTLMCVTSFANYILDWLKEASLEHGYEFSD